jgi:hypothetical protein
MQLFNRPLSTFFDVDNTLAIHNVDPESELGKHIIEIPAPRGIVKVVPHLEHIALIKQLYSQGLGVVVWSAGGAEWAATVIKALKLEDFVDLVISKPQWVIDDFNDYSNFLPKISYHKREKYLGTKGS